MIETIKMDIAILRCGTCNSQMIKKAPNGIFPIFFACNQEAQAKALGLQFISNIEIDYKSMCQKCVDEGLVSFKCYNCEETLPTNEIQESVGGEGSKDHLCKHCYETLTAKEWGEIVKKLEEEHQWDAY